VEHLNAAGLGAEARVGRVYDLETGKLVRAVPLPPGTGEYIALHPHRTELAVGLGDRIVFVDVTTGQVKPFVLTAFGRGAIVWHPHGELLAVVYAHHVEIWNVDRRRREARLEHTGGGVDARFNRTGDLLVTVGWGGRLRLWNPYAGRELMVTNGTGRFGPGDRLAARFPPSLTAPVGPLTFVDAGREYRTFPVRVGFSGINELQSCSVHPDGRLLVATCAQGFALIDLATGTERAFVHSPGCRDVIFERDGSVLIATNGGVYRWPVTTDPVTPNGLRVGPVEPVPVAGRGDAFSRSADGTVLAVPAAARTGAVVWQRDRPHDARRLDHDDCRHVSVSPDGKLVATGSWGGRGIKVWEADTGRLVHTLLPERSGTIPTFSSNEGRWLVNAHGGHCWRVADWSEGPQGPTDARGVGFSPDGRLAAWNAKGGLVLTDPETGRVLARLEGPHQDNMSVPSFSPDGTLLIASTDDSFCVRVWDLRKLRAGLAELGLDWAAPAYPPGASPDPGSLPLPVRVVGENLLTNKRQMQQAMRDRTLLALWLDPFDSQARLTLGESLLTQNRLREAEEQLTAALAFGPDQIAGYRLRATARYRLGNWDGCRVDAETVLAQRPEEVQMRSLRALALANLGRFADALPDLTAALANNPNDADLVYWRGEMHRALGKPDEAVADWKRAAQLANAFTPPATTDRIARRLLFGPQALRDPKRALELATSAETRHRGNARILSTLALAQYRLGLFRGAQAALGRSVAFDREQDLTGHNLFVLALCHAKTGYPRVARTEYQRALEWTDKRTNLPPRDAEELRELRAEAEGALHAAGIATEPAPAPREK
jgi:tetratricopeptide (TPR) repeat protein/WD40 repeat protein